MARPRQRVCLQDGLKLDLNRLARKGFVQHGANIGVRGITWTHSYWGKVASGVISANMSRRTDSRFRIQLGSLDQRIIPVSLRSCGVSGDTLRPVGLSGGLPPEARRA